MNTQYAVFYIDADQIILNQNIELTNFGQNLHSLASKCNELSMGTPYSFYTSNFNPFPINPRPGNNSIRQLALVLPDKVTQELDKLSNQEKIQIINSGEIFKHTLGHYIAVYDKSIDSEYQTDDKKIELILNNLIKDE